MEARRFSASHNFPQGAIGLTTEESTCHSVIPGLEYSYLHSSIRTFPENATSLTPLEHVLLDWLTK